MVIKSGNGFLDIKMPFYACSFHIGAKEVYFYLTFVTNLDRNGRNRT